MVILAALAAVGVYQGGKAVTEDVGKRARRIKTERTRKQERKEEAAMKQEKRLQEREKTQHLSVEERLERFKKNIPSDKRKGVGLFRKS